jgi:chromosome segregation protein
MYLKSLHIVGFKTFAEETELIFDPGFTAVVGPNGSGKSNIVDAIKWVLGEKSAKGLRGEKMDDVIFHGSESREPAGFAEVSVQLDNSNHIFNIDFPTIKITRRLYPDLSNEYFINNTRALRKDVEKLLLDTGVGKASYSIMEQGKVEAILNSKPEDRRAIFDEAAGISKFKMDRLETEKKLEYTSQNLLRINDIMIGMEKELDLKGRQAEKAKKYFQLKNDLSEVDKNLRYLKWKSLKNREKKVETELEEVLKKNEEINSRITYDSKLIEEYETKKYENEKKISEIDKRLYDFLTQKEVLREKVEKNKSIIQEFDTRIQEQLEALNQDLNKKEKYFNEYSKITEIIQGIDDTIVVTESSCKNFETKQSDLETLLESLQKEILEMEQTILLNDKEHNVFRENMKEIVVSLINQIEDKKRESESTELERQNLKNYLITYLDDTIELIEKIQNNDSFEMKNQLSQIQLRDYKENLKRFLEMEDVFRNILFDKDGMLARKEALDQKIEDLILENDSLANKIRNNNQNIEELREKITQNKEEIFHLEKQILEMKSRKDGLVSNLEKIQLMIDESNNRITGFEVSMQNIATRKMGYEEEVKSLEEQIEKSYQEFLNISKTLESEKSYLNELLQKIQDLKLNTGKDQEEYKKLIPIRTDLERKSSGLKVQLDTFNEELYNDYSMTDLELDKERSNLGLKQDIEDTRSKEIKSEMQLLGSINPLAIEEYQNIKEIYDHHKKQREDIEKSKKDIDDVLKNINIESEKLFLETFNTIKSNFQETFVTLFNGGKADIELTDKSDVLGCGIEIIAEPPGKHVLNLKLLSGGEKSLTVIALLFAIYMVRPSPFCFLDEIDAALDEVNKLRFCQILDKFKDTSQFIVITHAPPTISRANTIFGVTSEEPGISKIVSLKMDEAKNFSKRIQQAV